MYIYRFLNYENEVIYIGITDSIFRRIEQQHFTNMGHLPLECYVNTKKVEYMKYGDLSFFEAEIIESLLIEKYKPVYNNSKQKFGDIRNSKLITLNEYYLVEKWNLYKEMNNQDIIKNTYKKKLKEEGKDSILKITKEEMDKILVAIEKENDYRTKAMISTLILLNMRISECLQLTLEDIYKDEITIVSNNKIKNYKIPKELKEIWMEYLPHRINKGDKLFVGKNGSLSRHGTHKIWKKYANIAGVDPEKCHNDNFSSFTLYLGKETIKI